MFILNWETVAFEMIFKKRYCLVSSTSPLKIHTAAEQGDVKLSRLLEQSQIMWKLINESQRDAEIHQYSPLYL